MSHHRRPRLATVLRPFLFVLTLLTALFGSALAANASPSVLSNLHVQPGAQRVTVDFDLSSAGSAYVEVGKAPLKDGVNKYSNQYGDYVSGANGGNSAKHQHIVVQGLDQHRNYWVTIAYRVKGVQHYKRNLPITTKTRMLRVHTDQVSIYDDGDEHGCGEVDATGFVDRQGPLPFKIGPGWLQTPWTTQEDICIKGDLPQLVDTVTQVDASQVTLAFAAVDDDTVFGCEKSLSCGDTAVAQLTAQLVPSGTGPEEFTKSFFVEEYEHGSIGPAVGELGIHVHGSYSVFLQ